MTFINHSAFLWALLAVPIVLVYLWRLPPRRHSVGTGFLWQQVFSTAGGRSAWWGFRRPVSLCVQLAVLGLLVVALAEPHARRPRRLVIVIDNSASMSATDGEPTRLAEASKRARQHLRAVGPRDQVAIITGGDPLRVVCRPTGRADTLLQALEAVSAGEGSTRVLDAVALARRLLDDSPDGRILVFTDGCFDGAVELARRDSVRLVTVGGPGDNLGITRLGVRRTLYDPVKCQVLIEVRSFGDEPVECGVEVEMDGRPTKRVPITVAAGGRWQQVFEMSCAEEGRLTARLDRSDILEGDDRASVDVPGPAIRQVALADDTSVGSSGSAGESDVRAPAELVSRPEMNVPDSSRPPFCLWLVPVMAALVLVAVEWHLFQRRWTC